MHRLDIINLTEGMPSLDKVQKMRHPHKTLWKWQIDHLCMSPTKVSKILLVQFVLDLF